MTLKLILIISMALQISAAVIAFRLIGITGRRGAWALISAALTLMAVRRAVPLYYLVTERAIYMPSLLNESIGLVLSLMMLVGVGRIGPIFSERKSAEKEIGRLNAELEHRVRERTAQLEAANSELEAFAYSVSHDLRAPLRSIDGFSQLLLEDCWERLDDQGREDLQRVRRASQRMDRLIDDILKMSRVTRSEMVYLPVNLSVLARSVADDLLRTEPERKVEFVIQEGLKTRGDSQLLRGVLQNLLENAWKFTGRREDARIEFGGTATENGPAYFVRDNGAGFDMAYAGKLFGPFQRLHGAGEFSGTGIGLSIVQRIIRRHGGNVWGEGAVGEGATFFFTLDGKKGDQARDQDGLNFSGIARR